MEVTQPLKEVLYRIYGARLLAEVRRRPVPSHLGLIQDGHRRYARQAGLSNLEGYRLGADKAREVLTWCAEVKVPMVSLWWLSTENLARESADVAAVLRVIDEKVTEWLQDGLAERLRLRIRPIGKLDLLPAATLQILERAEALTREHGGILLNVGVGYGGRQEIVDAMAGYLSDHFSRGSAPCGIAQPNITIAGQSAPGEGICIRGGGIQVSAGNVILRHLRVRAAHRENGTSEQHEEAAHAHTSMRSTACAASSRQTSACASSAPSDGSAARTSAARSGAGAEKAGSSS